MKGKINPPQMEKCISMLSNANFESYNSPPLGKLTFPIRTPSPGFSPFAEKNLDISIAFRREKVHGKSVSESRAQYGI